MRERGGASAPSPYLPGNKFSQIITRIDNPFERVCQGKEVFLRVITW